jgi:2-polyprenyl-6-methoxyphenol hydroxylase-like FAD-dependent oxidoreductase
VDRRAPGWTLTSAGRPLIEATVRRRLLQLPGVTVVDGSEVTALGASDDGRIVSGVALRRVDGEHAPFTAADLVVDASARGSRTPHWLADLGYPAVERTQVDAHVAYASRLYRIPDGFPADWRAVVVTAQAPRNPRSGYLLPVEGGRWILGLIGAAGEHPPTDEAGFAAFMRELASPVIADAVAGAEPVSDVRGHRGTANRLVHYERMPRWPERFVVLGDAVCAFNPVYGQGMTTAAIAAETLDDCLRAQRRRRSAGDLEGVARRFQQELARRNRVPWVLSTGEDLRYPTTTGMTAGRILRAQHRYLDRVERAATEDPGVADLHARVFGMLERPTTLFRPRIVAAAVQAGRAAGRPAAPTAEVPAPRTPAEQQREVPA